MNKKLLHALLGLFLVVTLAACAGVNGEGSDGPLEASGTISAREANIAAELGGQVTQILVDEGDIVVAGAALFELDDTVLRAQHKQAQAAVDAYKHVDKALEICQKQLSQLPLPEGPPEGKKEVAKP